jgi:hypothetical protein
VFYNTQNNNVPMYLCDLIPKTIQSTTVYPKEKIEDGNGGTQKLYFDGQTLQWPKRKTRKQKAKHRQNTTQKYVFVEIYKIIY